MNCPDCGTEMKRKLVGKKGVEYYIYHCPLCGKVI